MAESFGDCIAKGTMDAELGLNLAVEVPFLFFVTFIVCLTIYLDLIKNTRDFFTVQTLQKSKAWLYLLYVVAVLVTILRTVLQVSLIEVPPELVTIIYNWATTLMVAISIIDPLTFLRPRKTALIRVKYKSLKTVLILLVVWVVALLVTIVVLAATPNWSLVLLVWRIGFMLIAAFEIAVLAVFVMKIKSQVKVKSSMTLRGYVYTTAFMRVSIVITVLLKHLGVLYVFVLKTLHMGIIFIGLASYCYLIGDREIKRAQRGSQFSTASASKRSSLKSSRNASQSKDSSIVDSSHASEILTETSKEISSNKSPYVVVEPVQPETSEQILTADNSCPNASDKTEA